MKRRTSLAPFVQKFRNVYIVLSKNIITIHTETNIGIFVEERWGGGYFFFWLHSKGVPSLGFRYMKG